MGRTVLSPEVLDDVAGYTVVEPTRFVIVSPRRGGPPLREIRQTFAAMGIVRYSGTPSRIFVDVDPGEPETPLIALDMIARSDAAGLERAVLSALPFVDEIVIGIDGRSDAETREVAEAYADIVHTFGAEDIGLTAEEWATDKIHFANARNLGRAKLRAPWCLQIDSDEYIRRAGDPRAVVRAVGDLVCICEVQMIVDGIEHRDFQRFARSGFRWYSKTHNQLDAMGSAVGPEDGGLPVLEIVHDTSLRAAAEVERRLAQRNDGVLGMRADAEAGNLRALFHLAKHLLFYGDVDDGARLADEYRARVEPHGPVADRRVQIAMRASLAYYKRDDFARAELWAVRALLDGPRIEAFCMLGDIAEDRGDLDGALNWYEAACVLPQVGFTTWSCVNTRVGRRDGLRLALGKVPGVPAQPREELDRWAGRTPAVAP